MVIGFSASNSVLAFRGAVLRPAAVVPAVVVVLAVLVSVIGFSVCRSVVCSVLASAASARAASRPLGEVLRQIALVAAVILASGFVAQVRVAVRGRVS